MIAPPDFAIRAAVEAGALSPCAKSKRGAAVFTEGGLILGTGWNAQPAPFVCRGKEECGEACAKLCEHAEQVAIREALPVYGSLAIEARLVHAKVVDGQLVAGVGPSCWQCSRLVLAVGLDGVWLDGVWLYERTWETCRAGSSDSGVCAYCVGTACGECEDAPHAAVHSPHHDRHYGLDEQPPRWVYRTALEFHRATIAECERRGWR